MAARVQINNLWRVRINDFPDHDQVCGANPDRYLFLPLPFFLGPVTESGNHSFSTGSSFFFWPVMLRSSLSSIILVGSVFTPAFGEVSLLGGLGVASSSLEFLEAASISSALTCSPRCILAAISGVTRMRRTFVWKPGAPFPIPCIRNLRARYQLRIQYADNMSIGGILDWTRKYR